MPVNFDPISDNRLAHGDHVPAKAAMGVWTIAAEYIEPKTRLRFKVPKDRTENNALVPNVWTYAPGKTCTADGAPKAPINPVNCLLASAPPGALIGKIGGSIAGKADGIQTFLIGSFCVFELDDKGRGPLYLAMNADPTGSLEVGGFLAVQVEWSA